MRRYKGFILGGTGLFLLLLTLATQGEHLAKTFLPTDPEPLLGNTLLVADWEEIPLSPINTFSYLLSSPEKKVTLPKDLEEISGLSFVRDGVLAAVQDEKARVFTVSLESGKILSECDFGKSADYEGVELVGETAYVTSSSGTLYKVPNYKKEDSDGQKFNTLLTDNNNVEGLGYFPPLHYLLLACKGSPNLDRKLYSGYRSIYAFDIQAGKLNPKPFLLINREEIRYVLERQASTSFEKEFLSDYDASDKDAFRPSGIAVHPILQDIYVIGTVGKLLLVYRKDGKLQYAVPMDKDIFKQPEGICFAPDGTLYISNEGRDGKGNILVFPQQTP